MREQFSSWTKSKQTYRQIYVYTVLSMLSVFHFGSRTGRNVFIYCVFCIVYYPQVCSGLGDSFELKRP